MRLHDVPDHCQPNSCSLDPARFRVCAADKFLEDLVLLFDRNAKTAVLDGNRNVIAVHAGFHPNCMVFGRVFHRVIEQIPDRAEQRFTIRLHIDRTLRPVELDVITRGGHPRLKVRNDRGDMVPLAAIASMHEISGPVMLNRYNLYPAALVNADPAPGTSSGTAIAQLEKVVRNNLGPSMRPEWTELALLQLRAGNTAMYAFILAVVLVFLVLAAQYESWSLPLAVILVVPMCLLCSIAGVIFAHMDVNIFTQIGFVVLVGLACKNAILIVEFARSRHETGVDRFTATLEACKLRLRPIIMTSLAFIIGVVPLVVGVGAGAEMRRTLGTAVFAGMLGVTLFGIFLTPVFFYVIQWLADRSSSRVGTGD